MEKLQDNEICSYLHVHSEAVEKVKNAISDTEFLDRLADFYKVFGDATRIKILYALVEETLCVCDIASILDMTMSAVSHQLKILKNARLIKSDKKGKSVFYSLSDDHVRHIIEQGKEHINE